MSILDQTAGYPPPPDSERIALEILKSTKRTYNMMVQAFNEGSKNFWNNPNASPQEIVDSLGSNAAEVFQLHSKLGQLLSEVKPEAISEGLSHVGNFIYGDDGSITIMEN
jgi:hypothetical protein